MGLGAEEQVEVGGSKRTTTPPNSFSASPKGQGMTDGERNLMRRTSITLLPLHLSHDTSYRSGVRQGNGDLPALRSHSFRIDAL